MEVMAVHPPETAATASGDGRSRPSPLAAWRRAALRLPLLATIAGANAIAVVATAGVALAAGGALEERFVLPLAVGAVLVALVATLALVRVALRPLAELEATAARVRRGDLLARVPASPVADRDMARLATTVNLLLDELAAERERLRAVAADVIRVGDEERSRIAHELHDSTAQALAAITLQLGAMARADEDLARSATLAALRDLVAEVMEEVRVLAHTVHPRVLDDLGLGAALQTLAREAAGRANAPAVEVVAGLDRRLPAPVEGALYRVAQEALRNALRHGAPTSVTIRSVVADGVARVEVVDDGRGFDVAEAERRRPGMGLFAMRERVALVGGALDVVSRPGGPTRIAARVPLATTPNARARDAR